MVSVFIEIYDLVKNSLHISVMSLNSILAPANVQLL